MNIVDQHSPAEVAAMFDVSAATVRRWVQNGALTATRNGRRILIPFAQPFIGELIRTRGMSLGRALSSPDELEAYSEWHETLDEFVWLIKVSYSPPAIVKKRRFRLDELFVRYLTDNDVSLDKVRRALGSSASRSWKAIVDDLRRGWYNELAYACPIRPSTLGLGFRDVHANYEASGERFAFPSWPIIQAYYSVYFFLRSIVLTKQPGIRLAEHGAAIRAFKHNVAGAVDGSLWFFPFNLSHVAGSRSIRAQKLEASYPHWRFKFARHPRSPNPTPSQCLANVSKSYGRRSRRHRRPITYGLFDLLHDFRVWVNYQDIDSILRLWGGYRTFLDMNVGAVLFFLAGTAEVAFIATRGERAYTEQLQELYELLTENNAPLRDQFNATPLFQRHEIYRRLGLVRHVLRLRLSEDRHAVLFPERHVTPKQRFVADGGGSDHSPSRLHSSQRLRQKQL
jgi:excisionase family DNA binding protein